MLADLPIDPNIIIVFGAVIFAAAKAFLEKKQQRDAPPEEQYEDEEQYVDLYQEYEAELERQRQAAEIVIPARQETPPPIPAAPVITPTQVPKKTTLSAAEKKALENFQNRTPRTRRSPSSRASTKSRVMKQLSSPTAAREALLLAEILGPPKALKPEENT